MGPTGRFLLRAGIATTLAALAALTTALTDGSVSTVEIVTVASATVGALGIYAGVGAAVPQVEPHIGNEL
jgi:hypothetical protein